MSSYSFGIEMAWLAPAAGFSAFLLLAMFRSYLPRQGTYLSILAISFSFFLFWFILVDFLEKGEGTFSITWFEVGDTRLSWGITVDALSVTMLGLVTFVALMVQIYSLGYMRGEPRLGWYFAIHSLFAAAMLVLVLADNLLILYVGWELVGVSSYLLIGFWYERRSAAEAAKKAFITTRLGDVGLLTGILLLFKATDTFSITGVFEAIGGNNLSDSLITGAALLIFLGAMGKSAQVPFHIWLPDAMEGPTPVSALIHAATMVTAGIFLVARLFPLFQAEPIVLLIVAVIGLITALTASTMALVMTDLKQVLAYSTISHLGFMMLALGSGSVPAAMFHLVVHGFAKAVLFLGAGNISHATDTLDIRELGGLRRRMPLTFLTFSVGTLTLAGLPPLSGWLSKDEILAAVLEMRHPFFLVLALIAALLSAIYMFRVWLIVFFGQLKPVGEHVHESPPVMTMPLLLSALLALVAGLFALNLGDDYKGFGSFLVLYPYSGHGESHHINLMLGIISALIATAGLVLSWAFYSRGLISADRLRERFASIHSFVANKYYADVAYQWLIDHIVLTVSKGVALFDRLAINDRGVDGAGTSVVLTGFRLRYLETGKLYNYALGMLIGIFVGIFIWWLV
jgi:NADH-quinone oxidoreductase subunit L